MTTCAGCWMCLSGADGQRSRDTDKRGSSRISQALLSFLCLRVLVKENEDAEPVCLLVTRPQVSLGPRPSLSPFIPDS